MPQVAVMVNVYDLSEVNEYARPLGIGIFHSGLVVHGREFSFGGHDYASSGIFETAPKAAPAPAIFREEVYVGTTEMNPGEVSNLVGEMDDDFHGNTYHLLERNCNHFVEALCFELTGKMPPGFINRLARTAVVANSCAPCILPVSIRAVADTPSVPPPPSAAQYTMKTGAGGACSEEGTGAGSTGSPTRRTRTTTPRCCRACRRRTGRRCGGTGAGTASVDVL